MQRAAEKSELVRQLVDSGDLYHPLAWTPPEAYRFLRELPAIEHSGVLVTVPDWWSSRHRARPVVQVSVGKKPPSTLVGAETRETKRYPRARSHEPALTAQPRTGREVDLTNASKPALT